jgi:hypothetical protein
MARRVPVSEKKKKIENSESPKMIYCFYLFDRDGVCLYYEDWNRTKKPKSLPGILACSCLGMGEVFRG